MHEPRTSAVGWCRDERGATAVEFAIIGPVFLLFIFALFGAGLAGFYQNSFDDSVRDAARQVQIDGPAATSGTAFVTAICKEFSVLASDCSGKVTYNVQASTASAGFAALTPLKVSASGSLPNAFFSNGTSYGTNENVLVQAAYPLPFTIPFVSTWITATGTTSVLATTTVLTEPLY